MCSCTHAVQCEIIVQCQFACHYVFVSEICKAALLFSVASNRCRTFLGLAVSLSPLSVIMFFCLSPLEFCFSPILVLPISLTSLSQPPSLPFLLSGMLSPAESVSVNQKAATVKHCQQQQQA